MVDQLILFDTSIIILMTSDSVCGKTEINEPIQLKANQVSLSILSKESSYVKCSLSRVLYHKQGINNNPHDTDLSPMTFKPYHFNYLSFTIYVKFCKCSACMPLSDLLSVRVQNLL